MMDLTLFLQLVEVGIMLSWAIPYAFVVSLMSTTTHYIINGNPVEIIKLPW